MWVWKMVSRDLRLLSFHKTFQFWDRVKGFTLYFTVVKILWDSLLVVRLSCRKITQDSNGVVLLDNIYMLVEAKHVTIGRGSRMTLFWLFFSLFNIFLAYLSLKFLPLILFLTLSLTHSHAHTHIPSNICPHLFRRSLDKQWHRINHSVNLHFWKPILQKNSESCENVSPLYLQSLSPWCWKSADNKLANQKEKSNGSHSLFEISQDQSSSITMTARKEQSEIVRVLLTSLMSQMCFSDLEICLVKLFLRMIWQLIC